MVDTDAPAAENISSISREPPRIFMPLASSGSISGRVRDAMPPDCHIQLTSTMPRCSSNPTSSRPTGDVRQA